jgi:hypothetical protein
MRSPLLAAVLLAATGCLAHLTEAGAQVRSVPADGAGRCTRVAAVSGTGANGPSTAENEAVATDDVRNQVARLGGNAFTVTGRTVGPWRTVVQADALRCPAWEPVRGLPPR